VVFNNLEEVKKFLEADKSKKDFSPIRYINVETLDMWVKLKTYLISICSEVISLSSFCEQDDTTPNLNRMMNKMKKVNCNTLVIPLSEHLRINNQIAKQILEKILKTDFENDYAQSIFRIYIPIYRMKSLINDLYDDERYANTILFIESSSDSDYALTIIQDSLDVKIAGNEIFGYKKYLSYWEQNPDKPIILHTKNAIYYTNIVFADDVSVIISSFELLRYHYKLSKTIEGKWGTEIEWGELAKRFNKINNLEFILMEILNANRYDATLLLTNWRIYTDFEKWTFWLWSKIRVKTGYLGFVMNSSFSVNDFVISLCNEILNLLRNENLNELYLERKNILELMQMNNLPVDFWDKLNKLTPLERIQCLTDKTDKEKEFILLSLQEVNIDDKIMQIIEKVYNDLYWYLQETETGNDIFDSYFSKYKIHKIQNKYTEDFVSLVNEIAQSKGIWWALDSRNYIVDNQYTEGALIYYIDALGLEYLPLLRNIFQSRGINVDVQVGYCNIPSVTNLNNDFMMNRKAEKEYELDKKKHEKADYPSNILREIDLINKFAVRAIRYLEENKEVIITSDHGSSRLAVLAKGQPIKVDEEVKVERHGRYCIDNKKSYGVEYSACIDKDEYHIFANYDRFSISGAPLGEIHGGATLEEVLVPIITLKKTKCVEEKEQVEIELLTKEIKQLARSKVVVRFRLSKEFENIIAIVDGKRYSCKNDIDSWSFEPDVGKDEIYTAKIVAKETLGILQYKIRKGISSNFDI